MAFDPPTMTRKQLDHAIETAVRYPHKKFRRGRLIISPEVYEPDGVTTNLVISPYALIDCTGSVHIGPWCNIGARCRIYTHDTIHWGRKPLAQLEASRGVLWQDKFIGGDVWIHDGAIVLYQVTHIPDGVVLGAGSVLTRNPGAFEIWAGNPARRIGRREEISEEEIDARLKAPKFRLPPHLNP